MSHIRLVTTGIVVALAVSNSAEAADDASILKQAQELFRPLPQDMATPDHPITKERVHLGRLLFFDPRLTVDGNVSCATCHQPGLFGTDARATSIGVRQRVHPRNAPTVLNAALSSVDLQWRGDRTSVEDQAVKAQTSPITGGHPDEKAVIDRLELIPGYAPLFKAAFPNVPQPITRNSVAEAIGAYERTLVTPSPFDAFLNGKLDAISSRARAGLEKFVNTGCIACHNGVGVGGGMYRKFGLLEDYWTATGSKEVDKGRIDVTKDAADLYVFRVASLRNVAKTAPYFHDGSVTTLPEAVKVMARVQLGVKLSDVDTDDIVAFLESLTGDMPADFVTAPVLPPGAVTTPK